MADIKVISKQNGVAIQLPGNNFVYGDPDGDFVAEAGSVTDYISIKRAINNKFVVKELHYTSVKDSAGTTIGTSGATCVSTLNSNYLDTTTKIGSFDDVSYDGTLEKGQVLALQADGAVLKWRNVWPDKLTESVKNVSGGSLTKGTPVHVTGSSGNSSEVVAADAATNYPAHFVLDEDLADEAEGRAIVIGFINDVEVADASIYSEGDTVYLGASGGWTTTKPTGTNAIQNLGIIVKVNTSSSPNKISGVVMGAGRSNDVPNIPEGQVWVGNSSGVATPTTLGEQVASAPSSAGEFKLGARLLTDIYGTSPSATAGNVVNLGATNVSNVGAQTGAAGATGMLLMVTDAGTGDELVVEGIVRLSSTTTTALLPTNAKKGAPVYMSTTAGAVTNTAPSTAGEFVRVVGHVLDATNRTIYFKPSVDWIEL